MIVGKLDNYSIDVVVTGYGNVFSAHGKYEARIIFNHDIDTITNNIITKDTLLSSVKELLGKESMTKRPCTAAILNSRIKYCKDLNNYPPRPDLILLQNDSRPEAEDERTPILNAEIEEAVRSQKT
ncbi:hypothetical protein DPMN_029603 [Dreissena polymorpha]|uniref:Uncharacterized protein n=1 Tax=Dreissena polymorpha TaxID=45954 RepID=A0A9D4LXJ4_DREPO|nr:hypothetical protein DPMN_029603 [Dreissena polymorpha]